MIDNMVSKYCSEVGADSGRVLLSFLHQKRVAAQWHMTSKRFATNPRAAGDHGGPRAKNRATDSGSGEVPTGFRKDI